jgi:hypothetical protein
LLVVLMSAGGALGQSSARPAVDCAQPGAALAGETLAPGWQRSYRSGCPDDRGRLAGGSEILHLVPHQGKLYAAVGYWMDPRNPWYGGSNATPGWAQVLRLDGPDARWQVDLEMPQHLRAEILQSVTFTTDGAGRPLAAPVTLLLASTYQGNGDGGISLFTRDDATGSWTKSTIIGGPTGKRGEGNSVRAMRVHRDRITGVDRLFISLGVFGLYSGVYDPSAAGRIRWDGKSDSGAVPVRPLAIVEANGALFFSADKAVYRRVDGPAPRYEVVHDLGDLLDGKTDSPVGGIRGLSAIANPSGPGQSLLFAWAPGGRSRACMFRLDPTPAGGFTRVAETCLDTLIQRYLGGNPVFFVIAGYNQLMPVTDPVTRQTRHLIGMEAWIGGSRWPTTQRKQTDGGYYAGALYAIRDGDGQYRMTEVNGPIPASNPALVSTRTYALSPFAADQGQIVYFAGYDCNFVRSSDTAWIFRASLANALREAATRK